MKPEINQNTQNQPNREPKPYNLPDSESTQPSPNATTLKNGKPVEADPSTNENARPNLFSHEFPSEKRDAIFDAGIAQSARFYLGGFKDFLVPDLEVQKAFVYGYTCAIHKGHMLHPALFLRGKELLNCIQSEVRTILQTPFSVMLDLAGVTTFAEQYLLNTSDVSHVHSKHLQEAFLTGYKAAFICNNRYDRCLLMSGHELRLEVLSSMIAYRKHEENARRAAARVVMTEYGLPKEQYRKMITSSNDTPADDQDILHERFAAGVSDMPVGEILHVAPDILEAINQANPDNEPNSSKK